MNSLGGASTGSPHFSPQRAKSASRLPWTETRKYGSPKLVELHRQAVGDIQPYCNWSKYGDNKKHMGIPRIYQDFGHIIDLPGPGEYTGRPELLSTEETMPKLSIGYRYPALIPGEKDALATPSPKYILPGAVQIKESQMFSYRIPSHVSTYRGESPSLVKYSPKHTIDSRYERFTAAVMAQRSRTVQPRKVIDVRNLTIIDQYLKHETMDPGLYRDDILKKDPRDKNIAITVGRKVKEVNPEGIDFMRPGPGYHDPDSAVFGSQPLGRGVAHAVPVQQRRKIVVRSQYTSPASPEQKIKGTWVDSKSNKEEMRKLYTSQCSFAKKPPEKRRATGKNMQSIVQDMQCHFLGRQSPGSMRFSHKHLNK